MSDDDDNLEYRFMNLHEFITQARTNLSRNNWDYLIVHIRETSIPLSFGTGESMWQGVKS